jgi:hypothetical protein
VSPSKIFAACVASVFLLIQLYVIVPFGYTGKWYWPFVDYRMYAGSWHRGDVIEVYEARGQPCDSLPQDETVEVGGLRSQEADRLGSTIGIGSSRFQRVAARVTAENADGDEARATIGAAIERRFPGHYCEAQIWLQSYTVGVDDPLDPSRHWNLFQAWPLAGVTDSR